MDRHTAKGSQLNRRDSMASHAASATSPTLVPADSNRQGPGPPMPAPAPAPVPVSAYNDPRPPPLTHHYHPSPQEPPGDPYPLINNVGPPLFAGSASSVGHDAFARDPIVYTSTAPPRRIPSGPAPSHGPPSRPSIQTNLGPYGVISPASSQQGYHSQSSSTPQTAGFIPQHNVLPLSLPPAQYSHFQTAPAPRDGALSHVATTASAQYSDAHHSHPNEMMILDHMEMSSSGPVFTDDGVNKSPYVGMPEDFMAYLFNSLPQHGSPHPQALPPPLLK